MCNFVRNTILVGTFGLIVTACGFKSDLYLPPDVGPDPMVLLPPPPPIGGGNSMDSPGVVVEIPSLTDAERNKVKKRTQ